MNLSPTSGSCSLKMMKQNKPYLFFILYIQNMPNIVLEKKHNNKHNNYKCGKDEVLEKWALGFFY